MRAIAILGVLLVLAQAGNAQYYPDEHLGPKGTPHCLLGPKTITAFANSPWQKDSIRSIRVRISRAVLRRFLDRGQVTSADEKAWRDASEIQFTLPPGVHAAHEGNGDPMLYTVSCWGAIALDNDRIGFWQMASDKQLYVSDSTAACMVRVNEPIHAVTLSRGEMPPSVVSQEIPRTVVAMEEEPEWMRSGTWQKSLPLRRVKEIFSTGRYYRSSSTREGDNILPLGEDPIFEVLKDVQTNPMPSGDRQQIEKARMRADTISHHTIQRGVILRPGGCFLFWQSVGDSVLEVRGPDGSIGVIVGD